MKMGKVPVSRWCVILRSDGGVSLCEHRNSCLTVYPQNYPGASSIWLELGILWAQWISYQLLGCVKRFGLPQSLVSTTAMQLAAVGIVSTDSSERTCGGLLTMTIVYPNCFCCLTRPVILDYLSGVRDLQRHFSVRPIFWPQVKFVKL